MEEDKLAKNILTDRNCYKCIYYVWELGDVEFCERNVKRKRDQDKVYNPYAGTEAIPLELTCEYWTDATLPNANKEETNILTKLYGYKDD